MICRPLLLNSLRLQLHKTFARYYVFENLDWYEGKYSNRRKIAKDKLAKEIKQEMDKVKRNDSVDFAELIVIGSKYPSRKCPSLLVNSGQGSYLFNCGPGFTRLCQSHYVKINRVNNVFLTNHNWEHLSGAIGLSIQAQELAQKSFTVHGNDNLKGFFGSLDSFILYNTGIVCKERSYKEGIFDDGRLQVEPIPLYQTIPRSSQSTDTDDSGNDSKKLKSDSNLISYCCQLPDLPGTLDADKCRRMKVPFGPHLRDLKEGKNIQLQDGRIILSSQVVGPAQLGHKFIIVECPTIDDINRVISNKRLRELCSVRKTRSGNRPIDLVVHLAPDDVTGHPKYKQWINDFSDQCRHLMVCHDEPDRINFVDAYQQQHALQTLDRELFPTLYLPKRLEEKVKKELAEPFQGIDSTNIMQHIDAEDIPRIRRAVSGDNYSLRRQKNLKYPNLATDIDRYLREAREWSSDFDEVVKELHENQKQIPKPQDHEPEVVFLGTSSAVPGKTRNTSGILVNFSHPEKFSVIFDCGEDTYGQLVRLYGINKSKQILKQLKLIYVSHQHADHHVGLIDILCQRAKLTSDNVNLILPPFVDLLLKYHDKNFDDISHTYSIHINTNFIITPATLPQRAKYVETVRQELCDDMPGLVKSIILVPVNHCLNATAVVVKFNINHASMPTWTIAYSGDCRPCEAFIEAGKGCDLLIHEATFDDRSQDHADSKKHCTTSEAIKVAKDMKAKNTILTHFSQRASKCPIITDDFDETIGIAFDNMIVRCPTHLKRLHLIKPAMTELFKRNILVHEQLMEKYDQRKIRESNILKAASIGVESQ